MDSILLLTSFHDKSAVGIKVQTLDLWQFLMAVAEIHREFFGLRTLGLDEIAVGERLREGKQGDVVGQEVGIGHLQQPVNVQGVAPYGIHPDIGLRAGRERIVAEGYHLALLREAEIAVYILQGIGTIGAGSDTLDDEAAPAVGTRHTEHWLGLEGRVGEVVIETDGDSLDRLQVAGIKHIARYFEGVNLLTRGEAIGE